MRLRLWSLPLLRGTLIFVLSGRALDEALRGAHNLRLPAASALGILFLAAYRASDQWHQSFVTRRTASVGDRVADTIGGEAGGLGLQL